MPTTVITGANSGIGLEAAVAIARAGHRVVLAVRNPTKGAAALADIQTRSGNDDVEQLPLDLASIASIRDFAATWNARNEPINVLINNAGVVMKERTVTADGFETTFGVNHLGHFLLTHLLLDDLVAAGDDTRVVTVASGAHFFARQGLDFDDLMFERRRYSQMGMGAYAASKLANVMFTRELARRLADTNIAANCVHPGFVATNFAREGDGGRLGDLSMRLAKPFARSPEKGARTSVHVALSPEVAGVTGQYFVNSKVHACSKFAADDAACARLWNTSESLLGLD